MKFGMVCACVSLAASTAAMAYDDVTGTVIHTLHDSEARQVEPQFVDRMNGYVRDDWPGLPKALATLSEPEAHGFAYQTQTPAAKADLPNAETSRVAQWCVRTSDHHEEVHRTREDLHPPGGAFTPGWQLMSVSMKRMATCPDHVLTDAEI